MITVIGDIAVDIVSRLRAPLARGSDAAAEVGIMPGGSGANVAVWLARLGQRVAFIGRVGDDIFGRWLADDLAAEGVVNRPIVDAGRRTGVIQLLVEPGGGRTMVPDRGANAFWLDEDVSESLIASADLLHVVGYALIDSSSRQAALQAMRFARDHGIPISLDPSSHAPLQGLGAQDFWTLVSPVSLLLPNRAEAQALTGKEDPGAALDALVSRATVVVIKMDRDGCLAGTGPVRHRVPAPPVEAVNATGTGDAFNAGFLASWLMHGDVLVACRAGVALGSYAVTLPGTR